MSSNVIRHNSLSLYIGLLWLTGMSCWQVSAQEVTSSHTAKFQETVSFLPDVKAQFAQYLTIHPDAYQLRLSLTGQKWNNKIGTEVGLLGVNGENIRLALGIQAFIELSDYQPRQFFSWQLWRGNVGLAMWMESEKLNQLLPRDHRFILELGWTHESQHTTDANNYLADFGLELLNDLPSFTVRSFEYIRLQGNYVIPFAENEWQIITRGGFRYFTHPMYQPAKRVQTMSWHTELGIHYQPNDFFGVYLQGFMEDIHNTHFFLPLRPEASPYQYRIIENGIYFYNKRLPHRKINWFWRYHASHGRSLDYLMFYEEWGTGLRISW